MSYAVLHIMKASGSSNAIARHIERSTQPDNAHPELRHLNRDDFIKYPDGVDGLGEAIQHRLDHARLTRKIGKNQCLPSSSCCHPTAMPSRRLAEEGRLKRLGGVKCPLGKGNIRRRKCLSAHIYTWTSRHRTFHVTVADSHHREKEEGEAKRKPGSIIAPSRATLPRLSADSIMTRENLTHFQDTYAGGNGTLRSGTCASVAPKPATLTSTNIIVNARLKRMVLNRTWQNSTQKKN